MIDIVEIKSEIAKGRLKVHLVGTHILIKDTQTGEAIKIGELQIK